MYIPKPGRDRCRAVSRIKGVALTFLPLWKSAHTSVFSQIVKAFPSPGQDLMGIRLMSYIPDQFILWKIKHQMHGDGKFYNAQIGGQMSPVPADLFQQKFPDFPG